MFLEGLASWWKDIKKCPERCASVAKVQHDILQLLRDKEQLLRGKPDKFFWEHSITH